ncbi:MAG: hypothetical protein IJE89_01475 [Bacilli bacterium]|nr:hypothetical protein [Bacilli bacterium]
MIVMANFSDPYTNICLVNEEVKILKFDNYNGEYNQGMAEQIDVSTIIGIFCHNDNLYLSVNNNIFDVRMNNVTCSNSIVNEKRYFELKVGDVVLYRKEYSPLCSYEEVLMGEIEEERDFLLYLTNILSSKQSIDKFFEGYRLKK